ncbi:MAG: hypothetical protein J6I85_09010 [Clostridia bacterium]|nr:hypothetical protein [Clostridia bacterium]
MLLILAGVTIAQITGQDSAPQKAAQARRENELGAAKDAATMLVTEKVKDYYEDKYVKTPATTTATNQLAYIAEKLGSGVTTGDYTVTVTAAGAITVTKGGETLATGTVSTDGVIRWDGSGTGGASNQIAENSVEALAKAGKIKQWDKINYNPGTATTANIELPKGTSIEKTKLASISSDLPNGTSLSGTINASDATDWVVIDVDQETGEVLIMPTNVSDVKLNLEGINGYNNAIEALDKVAEIYKNDSYASNSRSIRFEDIDIVRANLERLTQNNGQSFNWCGRIGVDENANIYDGGSLRSVNTILTISGYDNIRGYGGNSGDASYSWYQWKRNLPQGCLVAKRCVYAQVDNSTSKGEILYGGVVGISPYSNTLLDHWTSFIHDTSAGVYGVQEGLGEYTHTGKVLPVVLLKKDATVELVETYRRSI